MAMRTILQLFLHINVFILTLKKRVFNFNKEIKNFVTVLNNNYKTKKNLKNKFLLYR